MRKALAFAFISLVVCISACKKTPETNLSLNNGQRWKANIETTQGVANMTRLMDAFVESDDTKSYNGLSDSRQSEFKMIFKQCTMEGEAHNQLHSFLFPMKKMFTMLESDDLATCKQGATTFKNHLPLYSAYFE